MNNVVYKTWAQTATHFCCARHTTTKSEIDLCPLLSLPHAVSHFVAQQLGTLPESTQPTDLSWLENIRYGERDRGNKRGHIVWMARSRYMSTEMRNIWRWSCSSSHRNWRTEKWIHEEMQMRDVHVRKETYRQIYHDCNSCSWRMISITVTDRTGAAGEPSSLMRCNISVNVAVMRRMRIF